ncbi:hypothetical protein CPB97_003229 [Podila verticillata]|nr:hypothetical protein CPB97_003229 [Podila verticillata]
MSASHLLAISILNLQVLHYAGIVDDEDHDNEDHDDMSRPASSSSTTPISEAAIASSIQELEQQHHQLQQNHHDLHKLEQQFNVVANSASSSSTMEVVAANSAVPALTDHADSAVPISPKHKNVVLTNEHRKQICYHRAANPDMTLEHLADWAQRHFHLDRKPAMGTLSRILNKKERYNSMTAAELQANRKRAVLCTELDEALLAWTQECRERQVYVSYKMIVAKARDLGAYIKTTPGKADIELPSFSNGWVSAFTKRHGLNSSTLHPPGSTNNGNSEDPLRDLNQLDILPFSTNAQLIEHSMAARAARENLALQQSQAEADEAAEAAAEAAALGEDVDEVDGVGEMVHELQQDIHRVRDSAGQRRKRSSGYIHYSSPQDKDLAKPMNTRRPRGKKARAEPIGTDPLKGGNMDYDAVEDMIEDHDTMGLDGGAGSPSSHHAMALPPQQHLHESHSLSQQTVAMVTRTLASVPHTPALASVPHTPTPLPAPTAVPTLIAPVPIVATPVQVQSQPPIIETRSTTPTNDEFLDALRVVINGLDASVQSEALLFKPLFDLERNRSRRR